MSKIGIIKRNAALDCSGYITRRVRRVKFSASDNDIGFADRGDTVRIDFTVADIKGRNNITGRRRTVNLKSVARFAVESADKCIGDRQRFAAESLDIYAVVAAVKIAVIIKAAGVYLRYSAVALNRNLAVGKRAVIDSDKPGNDIGIS